MGYLTERNLVATNVNVNEDIIQRIASVIPTPGGIFANRRFLLSPKIPPGVGMTKSAFEMNNDFLKKPLNGETFIREFLPARVSSS